jgi:hypothetical protein
MPVTKQGTDLVACVDSRVDERDPHRSGIWRVGEAASPSPPIDAPLAGVGRRVMRNWVEAFFVFLLNLVFFFSISFSDFYFLFSKFTYKYIFRFSNSN